MTSEESWSVPSHDVIPSLTHDQLSEYIRLANVNIGHYAGVREALEAELRARSPTHQYKCMKCGHDKYQLAQFRAAQGGLGSFFGVESAQYQGIVCARCKFTEFYQGTVPAGQQALDFLFGG